MRICRANGLRHHRYTAHFLFENRRMSDFQIGYRRHERYAVYFPCENRPMSDFEIGHEHHDRFTPQSRFSVASPLSKILCVEKIRCRPRRILCVDKIESRTDGWSLRNKRHERSMAHVLFENRPLSDFQIGNERHQRSTAHFLYENRPMSDFQIGSEHHQIP